MIEAIDPKIGDRIIDPFCGTGGFLIYAFEIVSEKIRLQEFAEAEKAKWRYELSNRCLFGTDWKERTSQACKMNMMVHGDGSAGVFKHDGLTDIAGTIEDSGFDTCITNPPFGSYENDPAILARFELGAGRKSQDRAVLALERAVRLVKAGGWVAIVVIDGILNNPSMAYVRDYLKRNAWIRAVVSLNKETFQGYGSQAKTSILLAQRKDALDEGDQESTFMAIARNTGYAPNGEQVPGNALPDIFMDYREFLSSSGEMAADNLRHHPDSWVAHVEDRLDAEFYWHETAGETVNVAKLSEDVGSWLRKATAQHTSLVRDMQTAFANLSFHTVRVGDLLQEVKVRERVEPDKTYALLGVRSLGKGAFARERKLGREIKAKYLYQVSSGWIIYNRLFAKRGSFAVIGDEHDSCYVSGEFPTFVVKAGSDAPELIGRYVVHCLNSPQYLALVTSRSTGSTKESRDRFNQKQFLDFCIQMPISTDGLRRVVGLLDNANELRSTQETMLDPVKALREGVLRMLPRPTPEDEGNREAARGSRRDSRADGSTSARPPQNAARGPAKGTLRAGKKREKKRNKGKGKKLSKKRPKEGKRKRGPRRKP